MNKIVKPLLAILCLALWTATTVALTPKAASEPEACHYATETLSHVQSCKDCSGLITGVIANVVSQSK